MKLKNIKKNLLKILFLFLILKMLFCVIIGPNIFLVQSAYAQNDERPTKLEELIRENNTKIISIEKKVNQIQSMTFWDRISPGIPTAVAIIISVTVSLILILIQIGNMAKARRQQVFLELTNNLNQFSAPSKDSFERLSRDEQEKIKISYHNYLDGCEEAIRRECKFERLKNKIEKRNKYESKKAILKEESYPERLVRWYKNLQKYYMEALKIDDFEIPYHKDDPHLNRDHIVTMELLIIE